MTDSFIMFFTYFLKQNRELSEYFISLIVQKNKSIWIYIYSKQVVWKGFIQALGHISHIPAIHGWGYGIVISDTSRI